MRMPGLYIITLALMASSPVAPAEPAPLDVGSCSNHQWVPHAVDYRMPSSQRNINDMNQNHFNSDVRNLIRGQTSSRVIDDLVFMLQAAPNHVGALQVLSRYILRGGKQYEFAPLECFFIQAIRFAPDDPAVRQIYGVHLYKLGQLEEGLARLREALEIAPDSAEVHYNMGLIYVETKDLEQALKHAQIAYSLGYPLPGLRRKLQKLGVWQEPPPSQAETADLPPAS